MNVPYYADPHVAVWHGDCIEVLRTLPDCSIDAIVTDPPYGLEFMGKDWDRPWAVTPNASTGFAGRDELTLPSHRDSRNANCRACGGRQRGKKRCVCDTPQWDRHPRQDMAEFQAWCESWATECLRVLKPGGHLAAFGSTRTYHRLAAGIEDAGFEIRDTLAWMFGSGFPKSLDVARAIDKAAGTEGSWRREDHAGRSGARTTPGALFGQTDSRSPDNPEGLRHVYEPAAAGAPWEGWGTALKPAHEPVVVARKPLIGTVAANVLAHGTGALNIDACRIPSGARPVMVRTETVTPASSMSGESTGSTSSGEMTTLGRWPANVVLDEHAAQLVDEASGERPAGGNLTGSEPSRFFYTAKAGRDERPVVDGVAHPTVKPLDLMRWLIRLITPLGGTVLDPFGGSGTTAEAAVAEGFQCVTIEREATYLPLIVHRLTKPTGIQQVLT